MHMEMQMQETPVPAELILVVEQLKDSPVTHEQIRAWTLEILCYTKCRISFSKVGQITVTKQSLSHIGPVKQNSPILKVVSYGVPEYWFHHKDGSDSWKNYILDIRECLR